MLQVCHPLFCYVHGGDLICGVVTGVVIAVSLATGAAYVAVRDTSLTFLRCMGKEELFW